MWSRPIKAKHFLFHMGTKGFTEEILYWFLGVPGRMVYSVSTMITCISNVAPVTISVSLINSPEDLSYFYSCFWFLNVICCLRYLSLQTLKEKYLNYVLFFVLMMLNPCHTCLWKIHSKSRVDGCTNSVFDLINIHVHTENVVIFQLHKPLCLLLDSLTRLVAFTPVSFVDKLSFFDFVHFDECVTQPDR